MRRVDLLRGGARPRLLLISLIIARQCLRRPPLRHKSRRLSGAAQWGLGGIFPRPAARAEVPPHGPIGALTPPLHRGVSLFRRDARVYAGFRGKSAPVPSSVPASRARCPACRVARWPPLRPGEGREFLFPAARGGGRSSRARLAARRRLEAPPPGWSLRGGPVCPPWRDRIRPISRFRRKFFGPWCACGHHHGPVASSGGRLGADQRLRGGRIREQFARLTERRPWWRDH